MNCLRKKRETAADVADVASKKDKEELEELAILLEGRYVTEDYLS